MQTMQFWLLLSNFWTNQQVKKEDEKKTQVKLE
jgi:hypothetical protein